jgi:hypothetical protein
LFEVTGNEESVRAAISRPSSADFQQDVEEWLRESLIADR